MIGAAHYCWQDRHLAIEPITFISRSLVVYPGLGDEDYPRPFQAGHKKGYKEGYQLVPKGSLPLCRSCGLLASRWGS